MPPTTLSYPAPHIWQITLTSPPDHRLTPTLLNSLSNDLDEIEKQWRGSPPSEADLKTVGPVKKPIGAGAVILTGAGRFFSNGLDFEDSLKNRDFFVDVYDPVLVRLLTFPLVTIAAINGHAFAGGMILALACDFRLITSGKGMMSMNELQFGAPLPPSLTAMLTLRSPNNTFLRETLMAKRWTQSDLLKAGIVDEVVESDKLLDRAIEVGKREGERIKAGSWGTIKAMAYHSVLDASQSRRKVSFPQHEGDRFWKRMEKEGKVKVKAKL